jgi:predicted acylesterase/phospholipase RssA
MKALVLSGGGARGAFEAGVVESLRSFGPFDVICGTSAGAINGAFVAQDAYTDLASVWATIASRNPIQLVPQVQHLENLVNDVADAASDPIFRRVGDALRAVAEWFEIGSKAALLAILGAINPTPINTILQQHLRYTDLKHTLIVTATNITLRTADTYYYFPPASPVSGEFAAKSRPYINRIPITSENYVSVVQASTSIPGAFQPEILPVNKVPCQYVDGGVANNTPIGQAIDAGADEIYIIFMDPKGGAPAPQNAANLLQLGFACLDVMQAKILEDDLKLALTTNEALAIQASPSSPVAAKRQVTLWEVRPAAPLPVTVLQFDQQKLLDAAYAHGIAAGKNPVKSSL